MSLSCLCISETPQKHRLQSANVTKSCFVQASDVPSMALREADAYRRRSHPLMISAIDMSHGYLLQVLDGIVLSLLLDRMG